MTTNTVTIHLPIDIYEQASQLAEQNHLTLEEFLTTRVVETFDTVDTEKVEEDARMAEEESAYEAMHGDLVKSHLYQYVAIKDGVVVDTDGDELKLFFRIEERYPEEIVLMRQVLPTLPPELKIRSPRFDK